MQLIIIACKCICMIASKTKSKRRDEVFYAYCVPVVFRELKVNTFKTVNHVVALYQYHNVYRFQYIQWFANTMQNKMFVSVSVT